MFGASKHCHTFFVPQPIAQAAQELRTLAPEDPAMPRIWITIPSHRSLSNMRSLIIVLAAIVGLSACSHSKDLSNAETDSLASTHFKLDTTKLHSHASAHQYGPSKGKIRVANLLELNGQPSGAVDLYEFHNPDSAAVPLIKGLAFGQISDYVSPRAPDSYPNSPSNLWIYPAGTKQASPPYGDRVDNVGFVSTDQITVALGPTNFAGTAGISLPALDEAGQRLNSNRDSMRAIPSGQALLVLLQANVNADSLPEQYLMIDGTCPLTTRYPKNRIPTATGTDINFAVAPGTHTLGVVTSPRGRGLLNCTGKTPGPTTSVTVSAGQRYLVVVYGVPSDGFRVVAAPIAGS
jgi:hypothetical protein